MAVQHHLDQPLMHVKELDISPGFETQISVSPVLYSTTEAALQRFKPEERGCYSENELHFKYLPKSLYRYDISNCLFEVMKESLDGFRVSIHLSCIAFFVDILEVQSILFQYLKGSLFW